MFLYLKISTKYVYLTTNSFTFDTINLFCITLTSRCIDDSFLYFSSVSYCIFHSDLIALKLLSNNKFAFCCLVSGVINLFFSLSNFHPLVASKCSGSKMVVAIFVSCSLATYLPIPLIICIASSCTD